MKFLTSLILSVIAFIVCASEDNPMSVLALGNWPSSTYDIYGLRFGVNGGDATFFRVNGINLSVIDKSYRGNFSFGKLTRVGTDFVNGFEIAALSSSNYEINGIAASLINSQCETMRGIQIASIIEDTSAYGIQAGLVNIQTETYGIALAVANISSTLYGLQLGLVNAATNGAGLQIGLLNLNLASDGIILPVANFIF